MIAPRFEFRFADGRTVVGRVQGAGGLLQSHETLLGDQRNARAGDGLRCYEPRPGCVAVYPEFSAESNGRVEVVDLRDVEIEVAA